MSEDRLLGAIIVCLSAFLFVDTLSWPGAVMGTNSYVLTPYFFPRLITSALFINGAWILVVPEHKNKVVFNVSTLKLFLFISVSCIAVAIIQWDFFVGALVFSIIFLIYSRRKLSSALTAIVISGVIFFIFRYAFDLQIPNSAVRLFFG